MLHQILLLILFSLTQGTAHFQMSCPYLEDIYFVGNPEDMEFINNCSHLNSSLFITGDYNINNLNDLSNLQSIEGYLVILDSHLIRNLKGLHNLKEVKGTEKYLKTAGITFKYNNNFLDDENRGLCFTDLVNWTKISPDLVVDTNNGLNCPSSCHEECLGCFGPGPRLCQDCKNHKIGDTCVNYDCDKSNCDLVKPSFPLPLNFDRISLNDLNVSWPELNFTEAGGNILDYKLYRDNHVIMNTYFNDSGYETLSKLPTFYVDKNLTLDLHYNYQIEYSTESGSILGDIFTYNMYNWNPDNITNLQVNSFDRVSPESLLTHISFNSETNGVPYSFLIEIRKGDFLLLDESILVVTSTLDYNEATLTIWIIIQNIIL